MKLSSRFLIIFFLFFIIACNSSEKKQSKKVDDKSLVEGSKQLSTKAEKEVFEVRLIAIENAEGLPSFEPMDINVSSTNTLKFYYQNHSTSAESFNHNIVIVDEGMEEEAIKVYEENKFEELNIENYHFIYYASKLIEPGEEIVFEFIPSGTKIYSYICTQPNHYPHQVGRLKVD